MTTDLGKDQARAGDEPPPRPGGQLSPRPGGQLSSRPGGVPAATTTRRRNQDPDTIPLAVLDLDGTDETTGQTPGRTGVARQALLGLCALGLVVTVIPLVVLQIPDAVAWVVPPRVAAAGPGAVASLLRASGLALPAMAVAGSLAALMVRWLRAGPVLLSGLLVLAAADALGGVVRTAALIGLDRSLHGAGAGIAAAGVVAVVTERRQTQAPNGGRRVLAGLWSAFTVAGLAAAPELMRHRVGSGNWVLALQPFPWLTGAALALGALYALLAEGTVTATTRNLFPAAERTQLALLTAPVAGICAIALAVTYPGGQAITAAAVADALALAGIAAITARAATAGRFAVVCAVAGFTVSPAAGAVTALTRSGVHSGAALLVAALGGAGLAVATRQPQARAVTATGLSVAAVGFAALDLAGLYLPGLAAVPGPLVAVLCVPVAGGLAAALTAALRTAGSAGALAGAVILLAGLVAGYLAAGAVQLHAIARAVTPPAARAALAAAAGHWALVAAAVTGAVAVAMACTPGPGPGQKDRE